MSSASTWVCLSIRTGGGSPAHASARRRETWPAPPPCSRRPSASTSATSPRTCDRSRRCARVLLAQGGLAEALDWARDHDLSADDDLSYIREYEHLTLPRILLRQHAAERSQPALRTAYGLLERLGVAAEDGGRTGTLIEILTLQALAHHAEHGRRDVAGALAPLERALRLAEPEGYVRVFVGEGAPMATLLEALAQQHVSWPYPRRLRDALDVAGVRSAPVSPALVEQLSARELDVLRL